MLWMPPQTGKSELSTRRLPAFLFGKNPDLRIAEVADNHTVAAKFNRDVQRIVDSHEYTEIFPDTRIASSQWFKNNGRYVRNADEFEIVGHNGSLVSVGVGGGLTSRTVDILIIDDIYKDAAEAWSETIRESRQEWYDTVAKTRLHNDSQQLIVMTRWHEEDICGRLLEIEDDWEVVKFLAIKDGQALWPERHSLETLLSIKENNPIVFDSLYQQNPTPKEGLLLPASECKRFRMAQIKDSKPDGIVLVCDVADEGDDSLCAPLGLLYGDDVYIPDVIFTKDPIEVTQPRVAAALDDNRVDRARFESNNGGKGYALEVQRLRRGRTTIDWKATTANKHTRIIMKSGYVKEHFYFLVDEEQDAEYKKYFHELTHYPKNGKVKHDDAQDGTTMLAEYIDPVAAWGW
jgi:predicted phage terminase large subunit-like protein